MKILLTGANGYIGSRLLPMLVAAKHQVVCSVRDKRRFEPPKALLEYIEIVEVDFLDEKTFKNLPKDIDGAFYLLHSMSGDKDYEELELKCAQNFVQCMQPLNLKHVVYLGGMYNDKELSAHLESRKKVEDTLKTGNYNFTALRAAIIIGSGSASFEIIRDLVEKLPFMIAPKWLLTRCQPIGIVDVVYFLSNTIFDDFTYNKHFDIAGPDILTYKEMLLKFAKVRGLIRKILVVPLMTPKLSSLWLYFVTSVSFRLASALVGSMKVEVIANDHLLAEHLQYEPINYELALKNTLSKIESGEIISSWKDSYISGRLKNNISDFLEVPTSGCFTDKRKKKYVDREKTICKIWKIGGQNGYYSSKYLWKMRGVLDKMVGGVGLRRGRTHLNIIHAGDSLDFWRVLYANKEEGRLLLFAEMKLPGEAWLEFKIENDQVVQIATFRPKGLFGRLYWYAVYPFHFLIFNKMLTAISNV